MFRRYHLLKITVVTVLLILNVTQAQSTDITIYTPVTGVVTATVDSGQAPYSALFIDTKSGQSNLHSSVGGRGMVWDSIGEQVAYSYGISQLYIFNVASETLSQISIDPTPYSEIVEPIGWSNDGSNLLIRVGYQTTNTTPITIQSYYLYDIAQSVLTLLKDFQQGEIIPNMSPSGLPEDAVFVSIVGTWRNPVYDNWSLILFEMGIPAVGDDGSPGYKVNLIYQFWNMETDDFVPGSNLLTGSVSFEGWSQNGNYIIYSTSEQNDFLINLLHFSPDGVLVLEKSAMLPPAGSITFLNVRDIVLVTRFERTTNLWNFTLGQIIDDVWYEAPFFDLHTVGVSNLQWLLTASDEEKQELSCLFDLAQPQQLTTGQQASVLTEQRLRAEPNPNAEPVTTLTTGTTLTISGERACTDNVRWWHVTTAFGISGWAIEADNAMYYLQPTAEG